MYIYEVPEWYFVIVSQLQKWMNEWMNDCCLLPNEQFFS
jgi:hypothetical protein